MKAIILTPQDSFHRVHAYFKGSPYHPDGRRILYFKFRGLQSAGAVCLLDRESGKETVIGESRFFNYHTGAGQFLCDGGNKVIYHERKNIVTLADIRTGKKRSFEGNICPYSGDLDDRFLEIDSEFPIKDQGRMGIYIRNIDGTGRKCLATVDDLLAANPQGESIRDSKVLLRLGGEISPDQKKVILFLVTRTGALIRDYFVCGMDGAGIEFHGRLGTHIMWHPNSRDMLAFVSPKGCSFFGHLRGQNPNWRHGLLGCYGTKTMKMKILCDYKIQGGCHVSPSPDGSMIVMDSIQRDIISILLHDCKTRKTRSICTHKRGASNEKKKKFVNFKQYQFNPHPVFSRDSRRIVFNSCPDGTVRLYEIEVDNGVSLPRARG